MKAIRSRLDVTQDALAKAIQVSQGSVSLYENGKTIPPAIAKRLIEYALTKRVVVKYEEIYGAPSGNAKKRPALARV